MRENTTTPNDETDPITLMVIEWLTENIVPSIEEDPRYVEGDELGIQIDMDSLKNLIIKCFDDIQQVMLDSVKPTDSALH